MEVIQSVYKMALCPLQDPQTHTILYTSLNNPQNHVHALDGIRLSLAVPSVCGRPKAVLKGFGGFCGLHRLVDGVKVSYPHFESPQTAHGHRNGIGFSPALPMGGWGT